jgi:hypothetical protein
VSIRIRRRGVVKGSGELKKVRAGGGLGNIVKGLKLNIRGVSVARADKVVQRPSFCMHYGFKSGFE